MEQSIIFPAYCADFACIGSACEYTCCAGWDITIDKKTYQKYRAIKDPDFAENLPKRTRRMRKKDNSDYLYAEFVMGTPKRCPYLDEEGLCSIQRQFGEDYLSLTCRSYPRKSFELVKNLREYSLAMSCPEAIRKALYNTETMTFIQVPWAERPRQLKTEGLQFHGITGIGQKAVGPYVWDVRSACITIMQARRYSVAERIFMIGMMLKALAEDDSIQHKEVPNILARYLVLSMGDSFAGTMESFTQNDGARLELEKNLLMSLFLQRPVAFRSVANTLTSEYEFETEKGTTDFNVLSRASLDRTKKWEGIHWKAWLENNGHILENYFVNFIFSEALPYRYLNRGLNLYHHFIVLVEQYALLRMLFCSVPDDMSDYPDEFIMQAIRLVSMNDQHASTAKQIVENYKEKGMDSLAYMSFLLRS